MICKLGTLITAASGSVAATTFSNRAGLTVISAKARRANQQTPAQVAHRSSAAAAAAAWSTLTTAQRVAWNLFAYRNPLQNRLGTFRRLNGFQFFVKTNTIRISAGATALTAVPRYGQLGIGSPTGIYFVADGPYSFVWSTPTSDPHGWFILSIARPFSKVSQRKLYWHVLPAIPVEDSINTDISDQVDAAVGVMEVDERYSMRIRYLGENSLCSFPATFHGTVYAA